MHPLFHTFVFFALLLASTVSKGDTFSPTVQFTLNPHADQPQTVGSLAGSRVVKGDRLELSSTDGQQFSFVIQSSRLTKAGNRMVRGRSEEGAELLLGINASGEVLGSIRADGEHYQLRDHGGVVQMAWSDSQLNKQNRRRRATSDVQLEVAPVVRERAIRLDYPAMKNAPRTEASYPTYRTGPAQIDLLVYYQAGFPDDPDLVVDTVLEVANTAFADSDIDLQLNVAGLVSLDIPTELQETLLPKMRGGESPFSTIEADRSFYDADLAVALLHSVPEDDDACGIANVGVYQGLPWRGGFASTVLWLPGGSSDDGSFCTETTFAHEIGHLLGSLHERRIAEEGDQAAYDYSWGHVEASPRFKTIMSYGDEYEAPYFSNPRLDYCRGIACGVEIGEPDSADNATGFNNVRHMVAGYQDSSFAYELVGDYRDEDECVTDDGLRGVKRGHFLLNNAQMAIDVRRFDYRLETGVILSEDYDAGEFTINPGEAYGETFCSADTAPHTVGTEIIETWWTYANPLTGEFIESVHFDWDDDYSGEYDLIRIATSEGGGPDGAPSRSVRRGEPIQIELVAESGFQLASVTGTCQGTLNGSTFTIAESGSDCTVEAVFEAATTPGDTLRVVLEEPGNGSVYSGIGNLRGWCVVKVGVERVEIYIDDVYFADVPYGGARGDVGSLFPDIEDSTASGFSMAYNYNNLEAGEHTMIARSINANGQSSDSVKTFSVAKFHKPFFTADTVVNLNPAQCSVSGDEISVVGAVIEGKPYDILMKWKTPTQGFDIVEID